MPTWFPYFELLCALIAGGLWYLAPQLGPWPLLIGLAPWPLRLWRTGRLFYHTPFDWPLLLFVATAGLSVWAAYDRPLAWAKFWPIVGGVLLYYALANSLAADPDRWPRRAVWLLAGFGGAVTLYFLATHDWAQYPAKIAALTPIGQALQAPLARPLAALPLHRLHPNVVGGLLAMLAPFAAAAALARPHRPGRAVAGGLLLGLILFGLLLTTSRGAWLALAAALALAALWLLLGWLTRSRPGQQRLWFAGLLLVGLLVGGLVLAARPGLAGQLLDSLPALGGGSSRLDLYRDSLVLVQDYPLIGAGLDGFMMLHATYAFLIHVGYIVHSHNLYLDLAIEQGLPGLLALLWLWLLMAGACWRAAGAETPRPGLAAAALSLTVVALHGLVDDALYGSRALLLLFLPLAFAVPLLLPQAQLTAARWRRWLAPAGGAAALLLLALFWRPLASLLYGNLATVAQSRTELAVYTWPEWPIQDALRRQLDVSAPLANYARALALNPGNLSANRRLGQMELSLADYDAAAAHLARAYAAMPWDNATRQLYGEALIVTGRGAEGAALWTTVNNAQRQLDIRAFWYEHIGDAPRLAAVQAALP